MRAASFMLIAPVTRLVPRLFPNWRLGMASLIGILVLALVGIFTAELTRPTADYLRDGFFDATAAGFGVTDITVEGRRRTQREDLLPRKLLPACQFCGSIWRHANAHQKIALGTYCNGVAPAGHYSFAVREREPFALYEEGRLR